VLAPGAAVRALAVAVRTLERVFVVLAGLLTVYLAVTAVVFLQQSPHHYSTLVLAILVLSALLALRNVLADGRAGHGVGFWVHLTLAGLLLVAAAVSAGYIWVHAVRLQIEQPFLNDLDVLIGAVFLFALLLANWFHWGTVLTGVIGAVILYFFFGHLLGNPLLRHPPYDIGFVMTYMGMNTTEGAFAYLADGVEKLYLLVIFAAIMIGAGMINLVTELGKVVGRFVRGGAAFPAIVGSALAGTVMGAAVTNVVMTGKLTIPTMRRYGFKREFAAAVEVAASTAGQIIPPVMGLAAFLMAALLNISYVQVALIAVVPAFLYMTGVTIGVLVKAAADDLPRLREPIALGLVGRLLPTFVIPMAVVVLLLLSFYSPAYAGLFGIIAALVLCPLQGRLRPSLSEFAAALKNGLEVVIQLSLLLVAIGPLAQTFVTTNLAGRLSSWLIQVLPDNALILLLGAMVLALLAGMGLPTPAAYVLVALTLGHFLQQLGIKAIPAHFFIQYFAVFSAVTPPVALASLAGAKIAGAPFARTAWESFRLVVPAFFVGFAFIYHPSLLEFPRVSWALLVAMGAVILVQWNVCVTLHGFLGHRLGAVERGLFATAGAIGTVYLVNPDRFYLWLSLVASALALGWVMAGHAPRERAPGAKPALVRDLPDSKGKG